MNADVSVIVMIKKKCSHDTSHFKFFILLFLVLFISSCNWRHEPSEAQVKGDAARKLYQEKLVGDWYAEEDEGNSKDLRMYSFGQDGNFTSHFIMLVRDSSIVDGSPAGESWIKKLDLQRSGQWRIGWSTLLKRVHFLARQDGERQFRSQLL